LLCSLSKIKAEKVLIMSELAGLVCVKDFEDKALSLLPKGPLDYYRSGAGHENSLRLAREAYLRF
jgi:hypothetical protein